MALASQSLQPQLQQAEQLIGQKNLPQAEQILQQLLQQGETQQRVYELLGIVALETGRYEDAIARLQQAVMADAKVASAHYHLGLAMERSGKPAEAVQCYTRAATLAPNWVPPLMQAALLLGQSNNPEKAVPYSVRLCQIAPQDHSAWKIYNRLTHKMPNYYEAEKQLIPLMPKAAEGGMHSSLRGSILRYIQFTDWMIEIATQAQGKHFAEINALLAEKCQSLEFIKRIKDPMLLALMRRDLITQSTLETVLTQVRRALLLNEELASNPECFDLLIAFWALGFNNEYLFYISEEEQQAVDSLKQSLWQEDGAPDIIKLALIGSYTPLYQEAFAEKLLEWKPDHADIAALLKEQIGEPLEERALMAEIPQLSEIVDETSQRVRAQYESAPYPRWKEMAPYQPLDMTTYISRMDYPREELSHLPSGMKDVLVAGSGTGQHPIMLARGLRDYQLRR